MNLRTKWTVAVLTAAVVAAGAFPATSGAEPSAGSLDAQAAAISGQIAGYDHEIVALSEQLNGATYRATQAQEAIAEARRRTDAAIAERRRIRDILGRRAAQLYQGAGSSTPLSQMDVSSVTEMATRSTYASAAADKDNALIAKLQRVQEELAVRQAELARQQAAAEAEARQARAAISGIRAKQSAQRALLVKVQNQKALQARGGQRQREQQQRQAARAAGGPRGTTPRTSSIPPNFPNVPAPNAGAAAAVAFAKAQVGKGYRYATSGPDTFDCSGLTAAAWSRGGVGLAHYSGAQYQQTIRIGAGDLQPGDLIFYGPGGSNHVEIYIGGGMVVSASNPSTGVKMAGVRYGSATGYGRVRA